MLVMSDKDLSLMKTVMSMKEDALHIYLTHLLKNKFHYKNIKETKDYIIAEGDLPVFLIAHLDVVSSTNPSHLIYDEKQGIMTSLNGFGFDDRAGVWSILKLLQKDYRPHIIFTHGEESGGIGASKLATDFPDSPFEAKYMIQLDRRGDNDCVFYDCDNEEFEKYIESYGFETNWGSFTDISILAPQWGKAAVNLSIGYSQEHSQNEHLYIKPLYKTLKRVSKMLTDIKSANEYEYIPLVMPYHFHYGYGGYYGDFYTEDYCDGCYKPFKMYELQDVTLLDGSVGYLCDKCIEEKTLTCTNCGEIYEVSENNPYANCPYCDSRGEKHAKIRRYTEPSK